MSEFKLLTNDYFIEYKEKQKLTLLKHLNKIKKISTAPENFNFYLSANAVYSSMIEGNNIDFDTYLKNSYSDMNNKSKSFIEINDLKKAYLFAKENQLTEQTFLKAHKILSKTLISESKYKGNYRDKNVFIYNLGLKVYTGAKIEIVKDEMSKLFKDIVFLVQKELTISETFYYASLLHFVFVHIHPFADGNGRAARLLEKWFLANKLGDNAWFIQSEYLYHKRIRSYYKNLDIGDNYDNLNYNLSLNFLLMLPMALKISK